MHSVEYSGFYCGQVICGDWTLALATGGFWIWPTPPPGGDQRHAALAARAHDRFGLVFGGQNVERREPTSGPHYKGISQQ
jgi:hypothetical protein